MRPPLTWHWEWKSLLFVLFFFPLLLVLGFWQLDRAAEKQDKIAALESQRELAAQHLSTHTGPVAEWQPLMVSGVFDSSRWWLLDNRIRKGRFGYEVIAVFRTDQGEPLLVNRGWIAGDPSRRSLPAVGFPEGRLLLLGEARLNFGDGYSLGEEPSSGWPRRRQWLNHEVAEADFGASLRPFLLQLKQESPAALAVNRMVVNMSPDKHLGYAVQWFALGIALVVLALLRNSNILNWLRGDSTADSSTKNKP